MANAKEFRRRHVLPAKPLSWVVFGAWLSNLFILRILTRVGSCSGSVLYWNTSRRNPKGDESRHVAYRPDLDETPLLRCPCLGREAVASYAVPAVS
jgi:hypothetical protein